MAARDNVHFAAVARIDKASGRPVAVILADRARNADIGESGVRSVLEQPSMSLRPGILYTMPQKDVAWHLSSDESGLVYLFISSPMYPQRIAVSFLAELKQKVPPRAKSTSLKDGALKGALSKTLDDMLERYDDLSKVDRLSEVSAKVEAVTLTVKDSVRIALENCVKLEELEQSSMDLMEKADAFKKDSTALKNKMYWRMWKMRLLIGFVVVCVLAVIIIPTAVTLSSANAATKK